MTKLQTAIAAALEKIGSRQSPYGDSILIKQIRESNNIRNKKKASIRIDDVEAAVKYLEENGKGIWSLRLDSVNNILIKKIEGETAVYLTAEEKHNRLRTEKSLSLLTEADLIEGEKNGKDDKKKFKKVKKERWKEE